MAKMIAMIVAMVMLSMTPVAMAAKIDCEVIKITEKEVVLTCESGDGLVVGEQVTVKTQKKRKTVEGC